MVKEWEFIEKYIRKKKEIIEIKYIGENSKFIMNNKCK